MSPAETPRQACEETNDGTFPFVPPPPPLPHPLMELGDEPQLRLQVAAAPLCGDVPQEVLVSHAGREEHVSLVLPRLFILRERSQK